MRLQQLTPGDFAAVLRQHRFRPIESSGSVSRALEAECAMKEGAKGLHWISSMTINAGIIRKDRGDLNAHALEIQTAGFPAVPKTIMAGSASARTCATDSAATQASFDVGHQVGDIARRLV
ncbi:MAG: hypothetical protein V9G23_20140 [Giesbergeria sp.]